MPSQTYTPAQPDSVGMADLNLDDFNPEQDNEAQADDGTRGKGVKIRDQVELKKAPPPVVKSIASKPAPRAQDPSAPVAFRPGLPTDPRQLQQALEKQSKTGTTYEAEREVPQIPEIKKTAVDAAPPAMGTMVTNVPAFAQQIYGDNAPSREAADPLAAHGKDAHQPPVPSKVNAPPPPIQSNPPPPATAPRAVAPPVAAPAPANTAPATTTEAAIPKNAKKVVTTTTTTTKIVDGKEVVETHVHHDVVVKKTGMFGFLKKMGKKKTTTTTNCTTTTS